MTGVISTQSYVNPYQWSKQMGGGRKKSKKKTKTKAQKMAVANKKKYGGTASAAKANKASMKNKAKSYTKTSGAATAAANNKAAMKKKAEDRNKKFKQTKVQTFGGKKTSFTSKEQTRIKDAGYKVDGYSQAKFKPTPKPTPKVDRIDGTKVAEAPKKINPFNIFQTQDALKEGEAAREGVRPEVKNPGFLDSILNRNSETQRMINEISAAGNITGLGIGEPKATGFTPIVPGLAKSLGIDSTTGLDSEGKGPSYLSIKSPTSYGAPSQEAVDKAAGITAGGLNIGGGGFTPSKPSGTNARAIADYKSTLDPDSFKGLSDGETFGSGPVISGDDYARGLNISPYGSVENTMRSVVGKIPLINRIPGVNTRLLTDKEIADKRVKAAAFRQANLVGRRRGSGGGARLPVAPLTPEEILLPEETAVAQEAPVYQQALPEQTGVDPNRLMQIQQDAYLQAFNPSYNPMFRFFNRRGGARRGAFRRAFKRN